MAIVSFIALLGTEQLVCNYFYDLAAVVVTIDKMEIVNWEFVPRPFTAKYAFYDSSPGQLSISFADGNIFVTACGAQI